MKKVSDQFISERVTVEDKLSTRCFTTVLRVNGLDVVVGANNKEDLVGICYGNFNAEVNPCLFQEVNIIKYNG